LLTLMLFVALLAIAAAAVAPTIAFQVRRDHEEEMIHRGVQYSRAIRHFVKKFGRYPTRLEELENTNNLRFLRKRYKDPITGQDFKLLHLGEVKLMPGAGIAGANPVDANPGAPALGPSGAQGMTPGLGGTPATGNQPASGDDTNQADSGVAGDQSGTGLSGPVFGGGPIVGVVSTSKAQSIREFNKKNHYNQWQFIYDPASDRGGLLNTPAQPPLQGAVPMPQQGMPGNAGGMQSQPTPNPSIPQNEPPAQQPDPQ
jgi:type II secretory pathway pseudopilin PulG